jgi:protein-S-isoprenylcysteine O-methyltransferase Ste14
VSVSNNKTNRLTTQIWVRTLGTPFFLFVLIFPFAGRLDYWQGWSYIAINTVLVLMTLWALRDRPELIAERLKPGEGMKTWDKWYYALSTPFYFFFLIVSSLDSGRFGWSNPLPAGAYIASTLVYLAGQALMLWAKLANNYFSSVVRIQSERDQRVCREGPYRTMRHPGYVGGLLFGLSGPLMLGSLWGLIPSAIAAIMLVVRTGLEDRTLRQELSGYADYAREVRYRLLPGVW